MWASAAADPRRWVSTAEKALSQPPPPALGGPSRGEPESFWNPVEPRQASVQLAQKKRTLSGPFEEVEEEDAAGLGHSPTPSNSVYLVACSWR